MTANYFIAKYDSNGTCIWNITGISKVPLSFTVMAPRILDISYHDGNIYCTGVCPDTMYIDSLPLIHPDGRNYVTFILKIDTGGSLIWAKCLGGSTSNHSIRNLSPYNGGLFFGGSYVGHLRIDSTHLYSTDSMRAGSYLGKIDNAGNCVFLKNMINTEIANKESNMYDMEYDKGKYFYLTGSFKDTLIFPNITLYDTITNYHIGTYISKYDTMGNYIWAIGGSDKIIGSVIDGKICYNPIGEIYFNGRFGDTIQIDTTLFPAYFPKDIIIKIDSLGNFIWAKSIGRSGYWKKTKTYRFQ